MATKTAVVPQQQLPALASLYEENAGAGFENADAQAYAIPFLIILQAMSPQCKKSDGAYIKGAEEGMFYNTVTQELFPGDVGVEVIPCYYKRSFIRWAPRDAGGGYKGEFAPNDPIVATATGGERGNQLPDGDTLADTRTHYVLLLKADGSYAPAVVSLTSTQVRKSRQWMSKMEGIKFKNAAGQLYTPPMYSHVYRLTTVPEQNDQGSWFGLKVETVRMQDNAALFEAAKEFKRQIAAGEAKEQAPHKPVGDEDVEF